ncbi:hypothetical protein FB639_004786, partial [Coemansia asiatica]
MDFSSSSRRKHTHDTTSSDGEIDGDQPSSFISPFAGSRRAQKRQEAESAQRLQRSSLPLSVEDALRLRAQTAEPERPVFLTKAQRAQLALKRKQKEADAMRAAREAQVA